MALLIGNEKYERFKCDECNNLVLKCSNISVAKDIQKLENLLEQNDFIVTSYIDLEEENFLRVIRLFKEKCEAAKNVLVFIYIGAHGFHIGTHDFAVPVNFQDLVHENNHKINASPLQLCTLTALMENFFPPEDQMIKDATKYSVILFWDLCRTTNFSFPTDTYSSNCKELQYSIIFPWYLLIYMHACKKKMFQFFIFKQRRINCL